MDVIDISVVVPLWNEERNIEALVAMLSRSKLFSGSSRAEAVLVNNGSTDRTGELLEQAASKHGWVRPIHLPKNRNYGGGVLEGCHLAAGRYLAFMPGDLQYLEDDLDQVTEAYRMRLSVQTDGHFVVKGNRLLREDGEAFRFVSRSYTQLANLILGLHVQDINGLPKMFHRDLLDLIPSPAMTTFVFDAQLLYTAHCNGWTVEEVPVKFHARRAGVSSWSQKRIRVYLTSIAQLIIVRTQRLKKSTSQVNSDDARRRLM